MAAPESLFPDGHRDPRWSHKPVPLHRPSFDRIETLASTGHGHEQVAWRKAWRETRTEILERIDNFGNSDSINPTEGPATKWRKPYSKDRANVAVAR